MSDRPSTVERLCEHHRRLADPSVLNLFYTLGIEGSLDIDALRASFGALADRYPEVGRFDAWDDLRFELISPDPPASDAVLADVVNRERRNALDPDQDALMRVVLIRLPGGRAALTLSVHHAAADAWSLDLYARALSAHYAALTTGTPAPAAAASSPAFRITQWTEAKCEIEREALEKELRGWPSTAVHPFAPPPPGADAGPWALTRTFGLETGADLRRYAAAHRATPFAVVLAAAARAVLEESGASGCVLGTIVSGRRTAEELASGGAFYRGGLLVLERPDLAAAAKAVAAAVDRRSAYEDQRAALARALNLPRPADPAIFVCADEPPLRRLQFAGADVFPIVTACGPAAGGSTWAAHSPMCGRLALHWRSDANGAALTTFFEPSLAAVATRIHAGMIQNLVEALGRELGTSPPEPWAGPFAEAVSPVSLPLKVLA